VVQLQSAGLRNDALKPEVSNCTITGFFLAKPAPEVPYQKYFRNSESAAFSRYPRRSPVKF